MTGEWLDRNYFNNNPQNHLYLQPAHPSYDDQITARDPMHQTWPGHWRYFTSDEAMTSELVNGTFCGLEPGNDVLKKIYFDNAKRWYPGI